jgi:hypothetical protein
VTTSLAQACDAEKAVGAGYFDVPEVCFDQDSANQRQWLTCSAGPEGRRFERMWQRTVVVARPTFEFDEVRERNGARGVAECEPALVCLFERLSRLVEPVGVEQDGAAPRGRTVGQREGLSQRPLEMGRVVQQRERTLGAPRELPAVPAR